MRGLASDEERDAPASVPKTFAREPKIKNLAFLVASALLLSASAEKITSAALSPGSF
jgi:hypothetical protein